MVVGPENPRQAAHDAGLSAAPRASLVPQGIRAAGPAEAATVVGFGLPLSGFGKSLTSRFRKMAVYLCATEDTLPPVVYWDHHVSEKMQSNLLESATCGQNLDNIGLSFALSVNKSHLHTASAAMIGCCGCGWQG